MLGLDGDQGGRLAGEGEEAGAEGRGSLGRAGLLGGGLGLCWWSRSAREVTEVKVESSWGGGLGMKMGV